jgi:hypothetical protein
LAAVSVDHHLPTHPKRMIQLLILCTVQVVPSHSASGNLRPFLRVRTFERGVEAETQVSQKNSNLHLDCICSADEIDFHQLILRRAVPVLLPALS